MYTIFSIVNLSIALVDRNIDIYKIIKRNLIVSSAFSEVNGKKEEFDYNDFMPDYGNGILGNIHNFLDFGPDIALKRFKDGEFDDDILLEIFKIEKSIYPSKMA